MVNVQGQDDLIVTNDECDSDCMIIDTIVPESTDKFIQNTLQQSCISEALTSLYISDCCSSSSSLSSIDYESLDYNCNVLVNRLMPDDLVECSNLNIIHHYLNHNDQFDLDSSETSTIDIQTALTISSAMETRQLTSNYRQRFHSLAQLLEELADFDFPINRPLTSDDVSSWCIKKATDLINKSKNKT